MISGTGEEKWKKTQDLRENKQVILSASDVMLCFAAACDCLVEITSQLPWTFPALAALLYPLSWLSLSCDKTN